MYYTTTIKTVVFSMKNVWTKPNSFFAFFLKKNKKKKKKDILENTWTKNSRELVF